MNMATIQKDTSIEDRLQIFRGMAQEGLDPDYELLKRHFEIWVSENSEEAAAFAELREETKKANFNDFGATKKDMAGERQLGAMPASLFNLFRVLAPNFIGQQELTADAEKKRLRQFLKIFPVFRTTTKI